MKRINLMSFDLASPEEAELLIDEYLSTKKWSLVKWEEENDGFFRSNKVILARKSWLKKISDSGNEEKEQNELVEKIAEALAKKIKGVEK